MYNENDEIEPQNLIIIDEQLELLIRNKAHQSVMQFFINTTFDSNLKHLDLLDRHQAVTSILLVLAEYCIEYQEFRMIPNIIKAHINLTKYVRKKYVMEQDEQAIWAIQFGNDYFNDKIQEITTNFNK